jgi:hypothetical protein
VSGSGSGDRRSRSASTRSICQTQETVSGPRPGSAHRVGALGERPVGTVARVEHQLEGGELLLDVVGR